MMDKIPAALQHKIDYINALDIPAKQKSQRIKIVTLDYVAYCSEEFGDHFKDTAFEGAASFLDRHTKTTKSKWEEEQKQIEAARMIKGNTLGYNADSLGLVLGSKPTKTSVKNFSISKAGLDAQKVKDFTDSHEKWTKAYYNGTNGNGYQPNDKPIGPANKKIKEHIITWQYLALAAISGNLLGFAIFKLLERAL
jgi:hypothetical protein